LAANEVVLSSVSDSEADIKAALGMPAEPAKAEEAPVEPVAEIAAEPAKEPAKDAAKPEKDDDTPGVQRRINDITRQKYEISAERDRIARELEALKAQAAKPAPVETPAEPEVKPEPVAVKPKQDDFATYDEFTEALAEFKADQKFREAEGKIKAEFERRDQEAQARAAAMQRHQFEQQAAQAFNAKVEEAKGKYSDYDATVAASVSLPVTPEVGLVIQNEPFGVELGYYLMKNPAELDRINSMAPLARFTALGHLGARIEAGIISNGEVVTPQAVAPVAKPTLVPKPIASKAPMPPPRVHAGVVAPQKSPDEMTLSEYNAWRAAGNGR
jgi:hypothetical protein